MDANKQVATKATEEFVDNSAVEPTDALMDDLIAEVESEYESEDLDALPDGETGEAQPAAEGEETPAEDEATEPATEDEPGEGEADDRSVARLVQREVELRAREEKVKGAEERATHLETENAQLKQQLEDVSARIPEDFFDKLRANAWDTLEQNGVDPEHIVKVVLAQKLMKQNKDVPKELREAIRDAEVDYKFKSLEREKTQMRQQQAAQEFYSKVEREARQYINAMSELKTEFSKDAPTVAKVAKANPERVFAEIMDEIGRDANAKKRVPNATLISYAEASRRVEKRWADDAKLFGSAAAPSEASTTAAETKERAQQTGASTTVKKPVKPLTAPKAKTWAELEQEGLDAGLAEYKRAELARKKGAAPLRK